MLLKYMCLSIKRISRSIVCINVGLVMIKLSVYGVVLPDAGQKKFFDS